jgi:hypothetical protein
MSNLSPVQFFFCYGPKLFTVLLVFFLIWRHQDDENKRTGLILGGGVLCLLVATTETCG